jgi:hypothetical protein
MCHPIEGLILLTNDSQARDTMPSEVVVVCIIGCKSIKISGVE